MGAEKPDWYWIHGLHDAEIISYEVVELEYDYTDRNPKRNYLQLNLNAKHAMYDTSITAIRFYNYKCDNLTELANSYWLEDELQEVNNKFILKISFTKLGGNFPEVVIKFDDAEVIR